METAAKDTAVAIRSSYRIGLRAGFIGPVPVAAPLGDVAVHVMKPPRIRRPLCHAQGSGTSGFRLRFARALADDLALLQSGRGPAHHPPVILARHGSRREIDATKVFFAEPFLMAVRQRVARVERPRRGRPARVLPLRLRR